MKCPCCEREFDPSDLCPREELATPRPHDSATHACPLCYAGLEVDDDYAMCGQDICYCNPP